MPYDRRLRRVANDRPIFALAAPQRVTHMLRLASHATPSNARSFFFVLAGPLVPAYAIWSRGWRGLGWVVFNFVAWCAVATLASIVAAAVINLLS